MNLVRGQLQSTDYLWLNDRDYNHLLRHGWVDLETPTYPVSIRNVVFQVTNKEATPLTIQPVGVVITDTLAEDPAPLMDRLRSRLLSGGSGARVRLRDLVTTSDIARRLKRSESSVRKWPSYHPGTFPKPLGTVGPHRVWYWPDVRRWRKEHLGKNWGGRRGTYPRERKEDA